MAFQVGDRVRVRADASAGSTFLSRGYALVFRRGRTFTVLARDPYSPAECFVEGQHRDIRNCVPLDDGTGAAFYVHPDDLEMDPAQPPVLDRFAELAKDPAMIPVLEAAADLLSGLPHIRRAKSAEHALDAAMKQYQRDGAEC